MAYHGTVELSDTTIIQWSGHKFLASGWPIGSLKNSLFWYWWQTAFIVWKLLETPALQYLGFNDIRRTGSIKVQDEGKMVPQVS
jgi:hypothetical protein